MDQPLVASMRARAVDVPITPLRTASGLIESCPLVLIDLTTSEGITGRSYLFAFTKTCHGPLAALVRSLGERLLGRPVAPADVNANLAAHCRLLGTAGLVGMALGGLDMAAWDALARRAGLPLASLLGSSPRKLPAYWTAGLCTPAEARGAAEQARAHGCQALKIHRLDDEGLCWIEEPTRAQDLIGHAEIARGWLRASAVAHAHGLPVSSHFFPEVSAHLLAATPGAHWLELLDLASPVLQSPARIEDGQVTASATPGSGIEWDESAVERFARAG
jgi:mandelate racemase